MIYFKWLLTLWVIDSVNCDWYDTVARILHSRVNISINFIEVWCSANNIFKLIIVATLQFLREISIRKSRLELFSMGYARTGYSNQCISSWRSTWRANVEYPYRCKKYNRVVVDKHVCKDSLISINLNHFWKIYDCFLFMANKSLAPREWMAIFIDCKCAIIAAQYFCLLLHEESLLVMCDTLRKPFWFHITMAELTIDVEAPSVKITMFCYACCVSKTCWYAYNIFQFAIFVYDRNVCWSLDFPLNSCAQLAHFSLTPSI